MTDLLLLVAPQLPTGETEGSTDDTGSVNINTEDQNDINKRKEFRIGINSEFFNDATNGDFEERGVIVMEDGVVASKIYQSRQEFLDEFDVSWKDAMESSSTQYRVNLKTGNARAQGQ